MKNLISRDRECVANDPTKTMLLNVFKWIFNFQDQPRKRNPQNLVSTECTVFEKLFSGMLYKRT